MIAPFCVVRQLKRCHHRSDLVPITLEMYVRNDKLFAAVAQTLLETAETISNSTQLIYDQVKQSVMYRG